MGAYDSEGSKAKYQKLIGQWLAGGEVLPREPESITVIEVLSQWWAWAENHYRDARGNTTSGLQN